MANYVLHFLEVPKDNMKNMESELKLNGFDVYNVSISNEGLTFY